MKPVSVVVALFVAVLAPHIHAGDCTTDDAKGEALVVFLEEHYGDVTVMAYPSDQGAGLMEVYFHTYQPQEKDCEGVVKVDDDCRITDADGTPLDSARARQRTFQCKLSSG